MTKLTINGQAVEADSGQTVLEAAEACGVEIPTLCRHKDLSLDGSCRLCMVEIEGTPGQVAACTLPISEEMRIHTETPALIQSRKFILEMLLQNYRDVDDPENRGESEFLKWVNKYDAQPHDPGQGKLRHEVDSDPNPFIRVDLNKCILCTRCVRACEEVQGRFVWGIGYRGAEAKIIAGAETTMLDARCESCGACAAYCPTGALTDRMSYNAGQPDRLVTTTCSFCGVGCQFDLNVKDDQIVRVTSNPTGPANGMSLCVKGRYGFDYVHHADRLTQPMARSYLLEGKPKPASIDDRGEWVAIDWQQALKITAEKLMSVRRESGPDAIGFFASAKCTNEENYLVQKIARQIIGTHNIDHCARLCHSSSVAALVASVGSGAMSNSMDDIVQDSAAMFIIGANVTEQHPVFGARIRQAVLQRGVKLVVADPRKIDITEFAVLHLRQRPGTDTALLNGIMHLLVKSDRHNKQFIEDRTEGFDELCQTLDQYPPDKASEITGVPVSQLEEAADIFTENHPMAVMWAMGITQHTTGVMNVFCLANLQMLLGNLGVAGGGLNPLRGQNNVQGACDMGALPNIYPGYQNVGDPSISEKFSAAWMTEPAIDPPPNKAGLTATEIVEAAGKGEIRALYILGEDPAMTEPNLNHARRCLEKSEFIVLQEIFKTETAPFADLLLPGASFVEKDGTFTNTDRRVQRIRQAIPLVEERRSDWQILTQLANTMLQIDNRTPVGSQAAWNYDGPEQIMDEVAELTPIYKGINYRRIENGESLQWPVPHETHPGTPVLFIEQFTRGKGKFHSAEHVLAEEMPDEQFPLLLTTGRVLYHWHGGEMTRRAAGLSEACPESLLEISPEDARSLGIDGEHPVRVTSRRGVMEATAIVTDRVPRGVIFGNFHFPGTHNVNNLTINALDPVSKIPEYKICAVKVEVS